MFVTPPRPGQRRLAIAVAVELTPCIIGGSFSVKRRGCAPDVCWEGKKVAVVCSHLNPGSVMLMCVGDLEDLRILEASRTQNAHVHICVDAQTCLENLESRLGCRDRGTSTTITHRLEKEDCSRSGSSGNTCSLPQTLSGVTMTAMPTIHSHTLSPRQKTMENVRLEANRLGMSFSCSFQECGACSSE